MIAQCCLQSPPVHTWTEAERKERESIYLYTQDTITGPNLIILSQNQSTILVNCSILFYNTLYPITVQFTIYLYIFFFFFFNYWVDPPYTFPTRYEILLYSSLYCIYTKLHSTLAVQYYNSITTVIQYIINCTHCTLTYCTVYSPAFLSGRDVTWTEAVLGLT